MNVNNLIDEFEYIQFVKENPFGIKMTYFDRFISVNQKDAFKCAKKLKEKTGLDWRVPTLEELHWLVNNRIFKKYNTQHYRLLWSCEDADETFGWTYGTDESQTSCNKMSKVNVIYINTKD